MRALILRLLYDVSALPARHGSRRLAVIALPHVLALAIMLATESSITAMAAFLLAWGIFNFVAIALTRRPLFAGLVSLTLMMLLVLLSQLKYHVLMMTANFVDLMIVDTDTVSFLFTIFPGLKMAVALSVAALVPLLICAWLLFRHSPVSAALSRSKRIFRLHRSKPFTAAISYRLSHAPASTPLPN
jgi:hypothetical protein